MSDIDEKDIVKRFEAISEFKAAPEIAARDIARVRQKLSEQDVGQPAGHQSMWRTIMKSRITKLAAAAVIVATVAAGLYFGSTATPASAAERLEEIVKLNESYKGWLHITATCEPAMQREPNQEPLSKCISHMNTVDGTLVMVAEADHGLNIRYYAPADGEYVEYSGAKNRVSIYDLDSFPARQLVDSYPLTMGTVTALFKKATGRDPLEVRLVKERDYDRFDVRLFANQEEAIRVGEQTNSIFPTQATVWVDPNSQLIHRYLIEVEDKIIVSTIEYGEPAISEVYDLGVPKDAAIADHRKTVDVEALLDRLQKRKEGLNHYVAVMTETPLNDDGTYARNMCALHLFAQNNKAWLANRYLVGVGTYANGRPRASIMETPESWPCVDITSMLEKIKGKRTSEFCIYDGEDLWSPYPLMPESVSANDKKATIDSIKAQAGLAGKIWGNVRHGPGTKVELVSRDDATNQIGLRIEFGSYLKPSVEQRHEEYYWLDPERDDMPTERISRDYSPGSQAIENEFHTVYLDYSQLPDGRWYPTKWQMTATTGCQSDRSREYTREYNLYIDVDMELEKDWFTYPVDRLEN